jgi:hypothetical protein
MLCLKQGKSILGDRVLLAKTLLILGAGGHGKAVAESALLSGTWRRVLFVDDPWPTLPTSFGLPVVSDIAG